WFVRFGKLCEQNLGEVSCIIVALAERATERKKLLAQWQGLLQTENAAWPPDGNFLYEWAALYKHLGYDSSLTMLPPTLHPGKMKAARDKISKKYQALHAEQADLIEEAQRLMQAIVTSIEQKWRIAQKNPKFTATDEEKKHLEDSYAY